MVSILVLRVEVFLVEGWGLICDAAEDVRKLTECFGSRASGLGFGVPGPGCIGLS